MGKVIDFNQFKANNHIDMVIEDAARDVFELELPAAKGNETPEQEMERYAYPVMKNLDILGSLIRHNDKKYESYVYLLQYASRQYEKVMNRYLETEERPNASDGYEELEYDEFYNRCLSTQYGELFLEYDKYKARPVTMYCNAFDALILDLLNDFKKSVIVVNSLLNDEELTREKKEEKIMANEIRYFYVIRIHTEIALEAKMHFDHLRIAKYGKDFSVNYKVLPYEIPKKFYYS